MAEFLEKNDPLNFKNRSEKKFLKIIEKSFRAIGKRLMLYQNTIKYIINQVEEIIGSRRNSSNS